MTGQTHPWTDWEEEKRRRGLGDLPMREELDLAVPWLEAPHPEWTPEKQEIAASILFWLRRLRQGPMARRYDDAAEEAARRDRMEHEPPATGKNAALLAALVTPARSAEEPLSRSPQHSLKGIDVT